MRVAIIGAGALGSVLGALLTEAGVDLILLERDNDEVGIIKKQGLHIEGVSGDRTVNVMITGDPKAVGERDLVIVVVKSYDTAGTITALHQLLPESGIALTMQNGVGNFDILNDAFPGRVLLGTTTIGAMSLAKGHVCHTGFGATHLGEFGGNVSERAKAVAGILSRMNAGPVHVTDNAVGSVWSKLIVNAAINAPATLLRVRNGDLPAGKAGRELIHNVVNECVRVAEALGINLLFDDPEEHVINVCKGTAPNLNSMFQDVIAGRNTEIDFINGALVKQAEKIGLMAPVNHTLALLIKSLESTRDVRV